MMPTASIRRLNFVRTQMAEMESVQIIGNSQVEPPDVLRFASQNGVNSQLVAVFAETISWSNELLRALPLASQKTDTEKQRAIAGVLLARIIEIVECTFLLASRQARIDTRTMYRVFLDAYFVLANVCSDPRFLATYFKSDDAERLKLMRAASKHESEMFNEINKYASAEVQSELDARVKQEEIQAFSSFLYAEKVGCEDIYDSEYRLYSAAVHSAPRVLEDLVKVNDEGNITHIILRSDGAQTNRVLCGMHHFFCKALEGVSELFGRDPGPVLELSARGVGAMGHES